MEPTEETSATTRRKPSLKRLRSSVVDKMKFKRSQVDVNVLTSISNQSLISSEEYSNTSSQYSNIVEQFSSTEQYFSKNCPGYKGTTLSTRPNFRDPRRPNLDTLPHVVLYHLFKYLNAQDLCNLSWSCSNLYNITHSEKKLRENFDHKCNGFTPSHSHMLPFLGNLTTTLRISKTDNSKEAVLKDTCIEREFFKVLKNLRNLKSFTLENHCVEYMDLYNYLTPKPKCLNLTELKLSGITFVDFYIASMIFDHLHLHLPNLEVLDISYCSWVMYNTLWPLCRCSRLKKLITIECTEVESIFAPTSALKNFQLHPMSHYRECIRHSQSINQLRPERIRPNQFLELGTLDLRRTNVPLEEISRLIQLKKLKHIFMEEPEQSRIKRREQLEGQRSDRDLPTNYFQSQNCNIITLVLRNYSSITDSILVEIEQFCQCIEFLDLTGTKCTAEGLARFCSRRPEVNVWHESITGNAEFPVHIPS